MIAKNCVNCPTRTFCRKLGEFKVYVLRFRLMIVVCGFGD